MYCNDCGLGLVAGQTYCPRCGRATLLGMPPGYGAGVPAVGMAYLERRINSLAIGWLIYAGLAGIGGLMGLAFAHSFMHGGGYNHFYGPGYEHHFWHGPEWPFFAFRFARVALMLKVGLALAAGFGLLQKAYWGRTVAIVAGCLALLSFPFGTALGIWTLAVLLNRQNAWTYEAMAR